MNITPVIREKPYLISVTSYATPCPSPVDVTLLTRPAERMGVAH